MKNAKTYSAEINGAFTQIKAYNKNHALEGFKRFDKKIRLKNVSILKTINSHQSVWDEN